MKKLLQLQNLMVGQLIRREKKFIAYVKRGNKRYKCFFPNPSRLQGILHPGQNVLYIERKTPKSDGRVVAIKYGEGWMIIDTDVIHKEVAYEILRRKLVSYFPDYKKILREKKIEDFRIDYVILNHERYAIEVKGCFRIIGNKAYFPDAISERSTNQIYKLIRLMRRYEIKPYLWFIAPMPVEEIRISIDIDPTFYKAVIFGVKKGIKIFGTTIKFDGANIYFDKEIDVCL